MNSPAVPRSPGPPGPLRGRQVARLLRDALAQVPGQARVLDCGGGSGAVAVPLAATGAHVTVVDISVDALATLMRRAADAGVADRVSAVQGDVEVLADALGGSGPPVGRFDLVLAHGVLEAVDDPSVALDAMLASVRPGGRLSLLVGNPDAAVLARALSGDVVAAVADLRGRLAGDGRLGPQDVLAELGQRGLSVESVVGIGVFSELVAGADLDAHPGSDAALLELESLASTRAPYRDIAARVHIMARRPLDTAGADGTGG